MSWLKTNLPYLVIVALLIFIIFNTCAKEIKHTDNTSDTTIINNYTVYKIDTIYQPTIKETVPYEYNTSYVEYREDTSVKALLEEIKKYREELLAKNKYSDTVRVDSLGTAIIDETIQQNKIAERKIKYNLTIPEKIITLTNNIYPPAKNKWFVGAGVGGNKYSLVNDINGGLSLLGKNEQLYELKYRVDFKGNQYFELNTFWKIHF